jgi:hypothetical protein
MEDKMRKNKVIYLKIKILMKLIFKIQFKLQQLNLNISCFKLHVIKKIKNLINILKI